MSKVTNCAFCGKQITKGFLSGDATELTLSLDVAITCCEECEKKYSNELYYDHERFAKKIYNYQKKAKVKLTDRQIAHYFLKYTNDINKHNEKMAFEATPEFYAFYNYDEKGRFSVEEFQLGFRTRDIKIYDMALSKMENVTAIDNVFDKNDITKIAYRRKRLGDICGLFSAAYTYDIILNDETVFTYKPCVTRYATIGYGLPYLWFFSADKKVKKALAQFKETIGSDLPIERVK